MGALTQIVSAVGLFAAVHSGLASRQAKEFAGKLLGERRRDAYYRLFFNVQSVTASTALVIFCFRRVALPDREVWRIRGPAALLMNAARAASSWGMILAIRQIGFARVSGLQAAAAHLQNKAVVPLVPEAQGPALDSPVTGPFRITRHPLNFLAIPLVWLSPRMSRKRFVFNCAVTLYFILGSVHEKRRMYQAWGRHYDAYRRRTSFIGLHRIRAERRINVNS